MRVQEIMTTPVRTVTAATSANEAWNAMRMNGIRHLVVVDNGDVVGVLSERDAGGRAGAAVRTGRTVADLMTKPAVTVARETTVRRAASLMRGRSIGCLVVVAGQKVSGIVTVADLLALLGRGIDRPSARPRRPLNHRAPHRKAHGVVSAW